MQNCRDGDISRPTAGALEGAPAAVREYPSRPANSSKLLSNAAHSSIVFKVCKSATDLAHSRFVNSLLLVICVLEVYKACAISADLARWVALTPAPHRDFVASRGIYPPAASTSLTARRGDCARPAGCAFPYSSPERPLQSYIMAPPLRGCFFSLSCPYESKLSTVSPSKKKHRSKNCDAIIPLCGEGGIRTPGTVNPYVSLANWWFQPLTHLTKHLKRGFPTKGLQI